MEVDQQERAIARPVISNGVQEALLQLRCPSFPAVQRFFKQVILDVLHRTAFVHNNQRPRLVLQFDKEITWSMHTALSEPFSFRDDRENSVTAGTFFCTVSANHTVPAIHRSSSSTLSFADSTGKGSRIMHRRKRWLVFSLALQNDLVLIHYQLTTC
jgi:hypothetical protein